LGGGDLQDQSFLGGADRLEGVDEVIEKEIGVVGQFELLNN
jgi:hypothetical protein